MKVTEDEDNTIEEIADIIDKIETKLKFQAFSKVTIGGSKKSKEGIDDEDEGFVEEEEEAKELISAEVTRAENEMEKLKVDNKHNNPTVFQVSKSIRGVKKEEWRLRP